MRKIVLMPILALGSCYLVSCSSMIASPRETSKLVPNDDVFVTNVAKASSNEIESVEPIKGNDNSNSTNKEDAPINRPSAAKFNIRWKNGIDTILSEDYTVGSTPVFKGETPVKETNSIAYQYVFKGWDPIIKEVSGDAVYSAVFELAQHGLKFELVNGEYAISGINKDVVDVNEIVVPSNIEGVPVTKIIKKVGNSFDGAVNLVLPDTITYIENEAFSRVSSLKSITLPNNINSIGEGVFKYCTNLESITIPDSVESIGDFAFSNCTNLQNINFGTGLETIGEYAFYCCQGLSSLTLPQNLVTLKQQSFRNCSSLVTVYAKNNLKNIEGYAFYDCSKLELVDLKDGVESIGDYAFSSTGINYIYLPNTITTIGKGAFYNCSYLRYLSLPNQLKKLEKAVVSSCTSLISIALPSSLISVEEVFNNVGDLILVDYEGSRANYNTLVSNILNENQYSALQKVAIRSNTYENVAEKYKNKTLNVWKNIDNDAVCVKVANKGESVTFSGDVPTKDDTSTQTFVFASWELVSSTIKGDQLFEPTYFAKSRTYKMMFNGDNNNFTITKTFLVGENITYPVEKPTKEGMIFVGWDNYIETMPAENVIVSAMYLPNDTAGFVGTNEQGITKFFAFAEIVSKGFAYVSDDGKTITRAYDGSLYKTYFQGISSQLKCGTFILPKTLTTIGADCFGSNDAISNVYIPDTIVEIQNGAFAGTLIDTIEIPNSVKTIGNNVFGSCDNLEFVELPDSVTSLGSCNFGGCEKLREVKFPLDFKSLPSETFYQCKFSEYTIPNQFETIEMSAFGNCKELVAINIPSSVTKIHTAAFFSADKLSVINFGGTQAQWNAMLNSGYGTTSKISSLMDALPANITINYNVSIC